MRAESLTWHARTDGPGSVARRLLWPLVADLSVAALILLIHAGIQGPGRAVLALWFLLICTGMSIAPMLGIREPLVELLIGVLLGITLDTLVATGLAAAGTLTISRVLIVLCALCLAGTVLNMVVLGWQRYRP